MGDGDPAVLSRSILGVVLSLPPPNCRIIEGVVEPDREAMPLSAVLAESLLWNLVGKADRWESTDILL